jgi:hypothetical protein
MIYSSTVTVTYFQENTYYNASLTRPRHEIKLFINSARTVCKNSNLEGNLRHLFYCDIIEKAVCCKKSKKKNYDLFIYITNEI